MKVVQGGCQFNMVKINKTISLMVGMMLVISLVSAYDFTVTKNSDRGLTKVIYNYNNTDYDYWFKSYNDKCIEKKCDYSKDGMVYECQNVTVCSTGEYDNWIDSEMNNYISDLTKSADEENTEKTTLKEDTKEETYEADDLDKGFFYWVINMIKNLFTENDNQQQEIDDMKKDLCDLGVSKYCLIEPK